MNKKNQDMRRAAVRKNPHAFALNCAVRRALRPAVSFENGGPGIIVLIAPNNTIFSDFVMASIAELFTPEQEDFRDTKHGFMKVQNGEKPKLVARQFEDECQDKERAFVIAEGREALIPPILLAADFVFEVGQITERDFIAACKEVLRVEVTEEQAREALVFPASDLWLAARVGRPFTEVLQRLRANKPLMMQTQADVETSPGLEDMVGYGPAKEWGLQLRDDLRAWADGELLWSDVDKGLLLSGPPGTGKTTFAAALAKTCGAELVATSLGQWQASGHLGDTLRAMRRDFQTAKNAAPSILFIDEIDSVGDRSTFDKDHASYSIQVVNALLECIDGTDGREGVVVIGSTNNPSLLDPAVRRAGRLDKHVIIPLPDGESRVAILRQHLGDGVPLNELSTLRKSTKGLSGADLALVARDARRIARRQQRAVTLDDLKSQLPELFPVTGEYRTSLAYHEAGHTVVGYRLGYGEFVEVGIVETLHPGRYTQNAGGALFRTPLFGFQDRQKHLDKIAVFMAGMAAETLAFGSYGDGAGVGSNSDLELATRIATFLEAQVGMGSALRYSLVETIDDVERLQRDDPGLRVAVDHCLRDQLQRAQDILMKDRTLLESLAAELVSVGRVDPQRFEEMLEEDKVTKAAATAPSKGQKLKRVNPDEPTDTQREINHG